MRTIIIDDNKQAVKDLNERLARFSEVEVVAAEHSGLDGLARVSESLASCSSDFNILPLSTLNTKCGEIRLRTQASLNCMLRILSCAFRLRERMTRRAKIRMMTTTSDTAATVMA